MNARAKTLVSKTTFAPMYLTLFLGLMAMVLTVSGAEPPVLPASVAGYYRDFNQLTLRELQLPRGEFLSRQAFTLQVPLTGMGAEEILRQRLTERRHEIDPNFAPGRLKRTAHERVFVRVTGVQHGGRDISVQCEIYEPPFPWPEFSGDLQAEAVIAALDFKRMRLLRRETHRWRQSGGEWMLYGTIQELANIVTGK